MKAFLYKRFKLEENKTNIRTEVVAGFVTFFTMAYILFVNPDILGATGMNANSVFLATCISAAVGTILIGLLSNYPYAMASGMGLNAFFAFTICGSMGYSWQAGLAAVFISGVLFIALTTTGAREAVVKAIPAGLKKALGGGIGLFIAYIGLSNAEIIDFSGIAGGGVQAISFNSPTALLASFGIIVTIILMSKKVKGAILLGIVATTAAGLIAGLITGNNFAQFGIHLPESFSYDFGGFETFGAFISGFGDLFGSGEGFFTVLISIITVLISLTLVDMFDTVGTLIGTASTAGMLDEDGNLPKAGRALLSDAIATSVGAVLGTSTVTTYVESSAGISEGGRTGLTSMVIGGLFLLSILISPILGLVSTAATSPALIVVGVLMLSNIGDIDWKDFTIAFPAFITMLGMVAFYSISDGIALGFITYCIIALVTGKGKQVSPILYGVSCLFLLRYVLMAVI